MRFFALFIILNLSFNSFGEEMNNVCASKPNCVSSYENRKKFQIDPLKDVNGPWDTIKAKIAKNIKTVTNATVLDEKENFIHFVATTKIMNYKDDVYFWWNPETKELHMKSESRTGHWDMGANRKRLNKFIKIWKL